MTRRVLLVVDACTPLAARARLATAALTTSTGSGSVDALVFAPAASLPEAHECWTGIRSVYVTGSEIEPYADAARLLKALDCAIEASGADILLVGEHGRGTELAARLACRVNVSLLSGCDSISHPDGKLTVTRTAFGGRVVETLEAAGTPVVMTVKDKAFGMPTKATARPTLDTIEVPATGSVMTLVESRPLPASDGVALDEARIVISGGRGLGTADGFDMLRALASRVGAAVGSSRAAVDAGWMSHAAQVGQTGTTVVPDLYVAVGISGAVQHVAGMSGAKAVVAINTDEEAQIFNVADIGIVADYRDVLPLVMEQLPPETAA